MSFFVVVKIDFRSGYAILRHSLTRESYAVLLFGVGIDPNYNQLCKIVFFIMILSFNAKIFTRSQPLSPFYAVCVWSFGSKKATSNSNVKNEIMIIVNLIVVASKITPITIDPIAPIPNDNPTVSPAIVPIF